MASRSGGGESKSSTGRKKNGRPRLPLIRSFARIKPASADKAGGVAAAQSISGWDEASGSVSFSGKSGARNMARTFDHFDYTLAPADSQAKSFEIVCEPLVNQWLDGYDVDLICYGQTGSGKTYTQFGPPNSMQETKAALGKSGGIGTISPEGILRDDTHGFILRTGFRGLAAVDAVSRRSDGSRAVLHGSMVEMSILSGNAQNANDLLNKKKKCFVDKEHHLEGAVHLPLVDARTLVEMAAAVETRLTRGTKMNNSSSRSHCITVFTLHHRDNQGRVRTSRFNFFDFMGSERFSGPNAAHGGGSARSTMAGAEGIMANYSLLGLGEAVRGASNVRRKKTGYKRFLAFGFLNMLLSGSLVGHAVTAMVTCLSPSPRNGAESILSCKYSKDMGRLQNDPKPQPNVDFDELVAKVQKEHAKSVKIVEKGVVGKYMAKRMAEVAGYETTLRILRDELGRGAAGSGESTTRK